MLLISSCTAGQCDVTCAVTMLILKFCLLLLYSGWTQCSSSLKHLVFLWSINKMYVPTHLVVYIWASSNVGLLSLVRCINLVERKRVEVTAAAAKQASGPQISQSIQLNLSRPAGTLSFKQQTDAADACSATANTHLLGLTKCCKELRSLSWSACFLGFFFFTREVTFFPAQRRLLINRRWTRPELPHTACLAHCGFSMKRKRKKNEEKIIICNVDYLSQWLTFWRSTKMFRVGENVGARCHLEQTIRVWLWRDNLVSHCGCSVIK